MGGRRWLVSVIGLVGLALWWLASPRVAPPLADDDPAGRAVDRPPAAPPSPDAALGAADLSFNPGWIGAPCGHDDDCAYPEGFCLLPEEGYPHGSCSQPCERLCPDRHGDLYAPTFCVEDPESGARGQCMARCNLHLTRTGCRPGYVCATDRRLGEATAQLVCLPDRGTPFPETACTRQLEARGVTFARTDLADPPSRPARPGDPPPRVDACQVDTPVLLASPLRGVDYRLQGQRHAEHLLVSCDLALVLAEFSALAAERGVVEIEHMGTFACRSVAGTRSLSGHGHGLAIDVSGFERADGAPVSVVRDWGARDDRGRFLRELTAALTEARLFDVILTPASNQAHADHLHLEIR